MSMIDLDQLLSPVSDDEPCGEDLSDLTEYYVLEDEAAGREEDQFGGEARDADWGKVRDTAVELLGRGKELRVAVHLTHALTGLGGYAGLRDGLALIHGLLDRYWDQLYPGVDEDDDNPALPRMNMLLDLSAPQGPFMRTLARSPFCKSREAGTFGWRSVRLARGDISPGEGEKVVTPALIEAAVRSTDPDEFEQISAAVSEAGDLVTKIDELLNDKAGIPNNTANLGDLGGFLRDLTTFIHSAESGEALPAQEVDMSAKASEGVGAEQTPKPKTIAGEIGSQADVIRVFDKVCAWYERHEPSSPVPLLVQRAKRLVGKNFREIVRDVATAAEDQVDELFGREESENEGEE